ncbi:hypothetical protein GCM10022205_33170 [Spinactinospora alkalitolerans]
MPCVSFEYERVSLPAVLQAVDLRTTRNSSIGWPAGSVNRQIPDEAHLVGGVPALTRTVFHAILDMDTMTTSRPAAAAPRPSGLRTPHSFPTRTEPEITYPPLAESESPSIELHIKHLADTNAHWPFERFPSAFSRPVRSLTWSGKPAIPTATPSSRPLRTSMGSTSNSTRA